MGINILQDGMHILKHSSLRYCRKVGGGIWSLITGREEEITQEKLLGFERLSKHRRGVGEWCVFLRGQEYRQAECCAGIGRSC